MPRWSVPTIHGDVEVEANTEQEAAAAAALQAAMRAFRDNNARYGLPNAGPPGRRMAQEVADVRQAPPVQPPRSIGSRINGAVQATGQGIDNTVTSTLAPMNQNYRNSMLLGALGSIPGLPEELRGTASDAARYQYQQSGVGNIPRYEPRGALERNLEHYSGYALGAVAPETLPARAAMLAGTVGGAAAGNAVAGGPGEFIGALLGGGGAAGATGPRPSQTILANAVRNLGPQDTAAARALMERSQALPGGGIRLAGDEALGQVAGPRAAPLQGRVRQIGRTPRGAERMGAFNAARPPQVRNATLGVADQIAPRVDNPALVGTRAQSAADRALLGEETARTQATRGLYEQARPGAVDTDALIQALQASTERANQDQTGLLRNQLMQAIQGVDPAWDTGNLARYARNLRDQADIPFGQDGALTREAAGAQGQLADNLLNILRGPDQQAPLGRADAAFADISRNRVDPISAGPLGEIRSNNRAMNSDPLRQAGALYPSAPPEGQANSTTQAMRALQAQEPGVGNDLTRLHLVDALDRGTSRLQGGDPLMGGANTANNLARNPAQGEAWMAGVNEVAPNSQMTDLIEALRATGQRRQEGSPTATDAPGMAEMGAMDRAMEAIKTAFRPLATGQRVDNWLSHIYTNHNARAILDVLEADPASFERMMNGLPHGGGQSGNQTALVAALAAAQAQGRR